MLHMTLKDLLLKAEVHVLTLGYTSTDICGATAAYYNMWHVTVACLVDGEVIVAKMACQDVKWHVVRVTALLCTYPAHHDMDNNITAVVIPVVVITSIIVTVVIVVVNIQAVRRQLLWYSCCTTACSRCWPHYRPGSMPACYLRPLTTSSSVKVIPWSNFQHLCLGWTRHARQGKKGGFLLYFTKQTSGCQH